VFVDGELIFSKATAGRFPTEGEVEDLFAALKPAAKAPGAKTPDADAGTDDKQKAGGREALLRRLADKFRN
jgi:hypothetical protein